jgi:rhodanese-related sulfurtransferase
MEALEQVLREMDFEFFGKGAHKTAMAQLLDDREAMLIDVRSTEEARLAAFPLEGLVAYRHIPVSEVPDRLGDIPKDKPIGLFCSAGVRTCMVYVYLRAKGYTKVCIVEGGYAGLIEELKPGKAWARVARRQAECLDGRDNADR